MIHGTYNILHDFFFDFVIILQVKTVHREGIIYTIIIDSVGS